MLTVEVMKVSELPELLNIYSNPYIKKISHDHREAGIISHPSVTYLSAKIDDEIVGAFLSIKLTPTEIECHSLLTRKAILKSREFGNLFLDWAFSQDEVIRVTANIMKCLESAKNYVLKLGFKLEGIKRDAFMKNGEPMDLYILGITKKDRRLL